MTKLEKTLLGLFALVLFGIAIYSVRPTTQPSLGSGSLYVPAYVNLNFATTTTTTVANFPGVFHSLTIATPISGNVITIYDSATTTSPTVIMAKITEPSSTTIVPVTLQFDGSFVNGLTIQQTASSSLTVNYQQN